MRIFFQISLACLIFLPVMVLAKQPLSVLKTLDTDKDGISDYTEITVYHTDKNKADTDGDGYIDNIEIQNGYNPLNISSESRINRIDINLKKQSLAYYQGGKLQETFLISSGMKGWETPKGYFKVLKKKLYVDYIAFDYNYPHIKYNLLFHNESKNGLGLFVHSAPWRKKFGVRGSHGCVNVAQSNMEKLYAWANDSTFIHIF